MPRVISGSAGRIPLHTLKGIATRPTADKTKEAMFSVLQARTTCVDKCVLELFAGSGQLAIEALSRGAQKAIIVEKSRQASEIIHQNLQKTRLLEQAEIWTMSVQSALTKIVQNQERFDLIFADPPYCNVPGFWQQIAPILEKIVAPNGFFVLEYSSREEDSSLAAVENIEVVTKLKLIKRCQYGAAMVLFLQNS